MLERLDGVVEAPASDAPIWRFMDFTKYVSMLHRRALFFARADQLPDPFEGLFARRNRGLAPPASKPRKVHQRVFVSCWHANEHESAAMWRIYLNGEEGIAVRSTVSRLRSVLSQATDTFYLGIVRYLDYQKERVPEGDELHPFFCKRKSFDYEREVRALWRAGDRSDEVGRYVAAQLDALIEEVVVSPTAERWFEDLVRSVTEKYGLSLPIVSSSMRDPPGE
ncbi:DUF2971 domain-containing protein [Pendulispora rubella]|uniref:DUF2971 domain-containing protein n=1 Tax=Pendulispora rubella TaxID=2741070 RepID=A0ABZ2L6S2_9BACT